MQKKIFTGASNNALCSCFRRHRQSVESKYVAKLNLDELERFSEQVDSLPCSIKESGLIQVLTAMRTTKIECFLWLCVRDQSAR